MAENILHSGGFVDRSGNEIQITFYKRSATSVMTVDPTALSFIAAGESKTLRVSGYTGTLSINVTGAWLTYTQSTSSGVRTYTLTASQNNTTTVRSSIITLTDANNTVTVQAVQAGTISGIVINPSYITMDAAGGTQQVSISWTGGHAPTYSGNASWVGLNTSTSGSTMTVTVAVGENEGDVRSNDIVFTNGISSATLHITQNAASVMYLSPNMLSFGSEGGSGSVTVWWTGEDTPTYSISYASGSGWLSGQGGTPSAGERTYTFTASANGTTSTRSATITFTNGHVTATVTVDQAGLTPDVITVDKTVINNIPATACTDIVTVTYSGQGYITPTGMPAWVDVRYKDAPSATTVRYDFIFSQNSGAARSATITFNSSLGGTATTTVNQLAAEVAWTVSPSTINNVDYQGHTYNLLFTGTPSAGMDYDVTYGSGSGWVTVNIETLSSATVTVGANAGSQRTATVTFYKMGDRSTYVTVNITQNAMPVAWTVTPSSIPNATASGLTYTVTIAGAPSGGMSYDVTYGSGSGWVTVSNFSNSGCSVTLAANGNTSSRSATITFYDQDDNTNYRTLTITQAGTELGALTVRDVSMSFTAAGGRRDTIVENISGTLMHSEPDWITLALSGSGATRLVGVRASAYFMNTSRSGSVNFWDDRMDQVSMAVTQEAITPATSHTFSVDPSEVYMTRNGNIQRMTVTSEPSAGLGTGSNVSWLSATYDSSYDYWYIAATINQENRVRTGTVYFYDLNDFNNRVSVAVRQLQSAPGIIPSTMSFTAAGGTKEFAGRTYSGNATYPSISYSGSDTGWVTSSQSAGQDFKGSVTVASNAGPERSATMVYKDSGNNWIGVISVTQEGEEQPVEDVIVTPSSLSFPYSAQAATLSVSGVSQGFNYNITYANPDISGWLSPTKTAYNLILTASTNTLPGSRAATVEITSALTGDGVLVPVTQAGNPGVLSVTPNAWYYTSGLGTHEFTIIYNPSGSITWRVVYDRQPGELEVDWLEVDLVSHDAGSDTWIYSIDVGPNNTSSGRAAMVYFEGDGGGSDEVSVYQAPTT